MLVRGLVPCVNMTLNRHHLCDSKSQISVEFRNKLSRYIIISSVVLLGICVKIEFYIL